jgi:hypothetical protein
LEIVVERRILKIEDEVLPGCYNNIFSSERDFSRGP